MAITSKISLFPWAQPRLWIGNLTVLTLLCMLIPGCVGSEEEQAEQPAHAPDPADAIEPLPYQEEILAEGIDVKLYTNSTRPTFSHDRLNVAVFKPEGPYKPGRLEHNGKPITDRVANATDLLFSPDGKRLAAQVRPIDSRLTHIMVDGDMGPGYRNIFTPVRFSPDAKHYACVVERGEGRDRQTGVVLDGRLIAASVRGARIDFNSLAFTPDNRLFYIEYGRQGITAMLDGQMMATHANASRIEKISVRFSPDGKRIAYALSIGREYAYAIDGMVEPQTYPSVRQFTFSPDGSRYGYYANDGKHTYVVIDGKPSDPLPKAYDREQHVFFSPDSKRVAYIVVRERTVQSKERIWPVVDGQAQPELQANGPGPAGGFCFSGDSKHFAYTDRQGVILDGKRHGPECEGHHFPGTFVGPDHTDLVFAGRSSVYQGGERASMKWQVFRDGEPGEAYNSVEWMQVSPDRTQVAFLAKDYKRSGGACVVLNGEEQGRHDRMQGGMVVFASDSNRIAYPASSKVGNRSSRYYVVDGLRFEVEHNGIDIGLSPMGTHFYRQENALWIDDRQVDKDQRVLTWPPAFINEHTAQYLAIRGDKLYRITQPLK